MQSHPIGFLEPPPVTQKQIDQFWEKGYLLFPTPLLTSGVCYYLPFMSIAFSVCSDSIAALRVEFERLFAGEIDMDGVPQEYEFWLHVIHQVSGVVWYGGGV